MTIWNGYITRAGFLSWIDTPTATDTTDDAVIDTIITAVSRKIDDLTARRFYPYRQTRKYDIPSLIEGSELSLNDDLVEVYTLTNGDLTVITTTDYILLPVNDPPYYAVKLRDISDVDWEQDSNDSSEQVISLDGLWSYRPRYTSDGWTSIGTLGAAIADTTGLTVTLTAGHTAVTGQIWKVDSEIFQGSVATNTVTLIKRGDNGTTAATHSNGATVYAWNVYEPVALAAYEISLNAYRRRGGENAGGIAQVTAAGVVITPSDIPMATYRSLLQMGRFA